MFKSAMISDTDNLTDREEISMYELEAVISKFKTCKRCGQTYLPPQKKVRISDCDSSKDDVPSTSQPAQKPK
jgi:uncharacterized OB-fold protein